MSKPTSDAELRSSYWRDEIARHSADEWLADRAAVRKLVEEILTWKIIEIDVPNDEGEPAAPELRAILERMKGWGGQ